MSQEIDDGTGPTAPRSNLGRALSRAADALDRWRVAAACPAVDFEDAIY